MLCHVDYYCCYYLIFFLKKYFYLIVVTVNSDFVVYCYNLLQSPCCSLGLASTYSKN